jgi:hypothetical protein
LQLDLSAEVALPILALFPVSEETRVVWPRLVAMALHSTLSGRNQLLDFAGCHRVQTCCLQLQKHVTLVQILGPINREQKTVNASRSVSSIFEQR